MTSRSVEERLSQLEEKVAGLLGEQTESDNDAPWWEKWFGAFKDDRDFDAAMERGAEYRRSQPAAADEHENNVSA